MATGLGNRRPRASKKAPAAITARCVMDMAAAWFGNVIGHCQTATTTALRNTENVPYWYSPRQVAASPSVRTEQRPVALVPRAGHIRKHRQDGNGVIVVEKQARIAPQQQQDKTRWLTGLPSTRPRHGGGVGKASTPVNGPLPGAFVNRHAWNLDCRGWAHRRPRYRVKVPKVGGTDAMDKPSVITNAAGGAPALQLIPRPAAWRESSRPASPD